MSLVESLSPETAYALKGNVALPFQDARSAANINTLAQTRIQDAATDSVGAGTTQRVTAITVAGAVKANR